jgi:hypothetical protein
MIDPDVFNDIPFLNCATTKNDKYQPNKFSSRNSKEAKLFSKPAISQCHDIQGAIQRGIRERLISQDRINTHEN